jgi:putative ABC transport system permease protein
MYFANTMNAISLAAERYHSELHNHQPENKARLSAFHASMIPQINSLLAVGIVALPGMMTGQILSGVSPLIAVRYQIMIMAMILGTTGMGAALMLWLLSRRKN